MIGRTIGNYQIVEKIGEGGMGTVYRATELLVERDVAIKMMRAEFAQNPELNQRFRTEAVALARLNHPAIATLYSFFPDGAELFMAMEFVPGETLEKRIQRQGAMPWQQAVEVLLWSLDAVRHAHQMGILHRDLKPANIMITPEGRVKVTDFGIARVLNSVKLTREARVVGTVEYLAPERALGKPADARSDLYSLGVVFYEMLTGQVPFRADSDIGLIRAQIEQAPVQPKLLGVNVPTEVEQALMKALAKNPDDRFPDAAAFAAEFREAVRHTGMSLGSRPTRLASAAPTAAVTRPAEMRNPPPKKNAFQSMAAAPVAQKQARNQKAMMVAAGVATFLLFSGVYLALRGGNGSAQKDRGPVPPAHNTVPSLAPPASVIPPSNEPAELRPIAPSVTVANVVPSSGVPPAENRPAQSGQTPAPPRPSAGTPSTGTRPADGRSDKAKLREAVLAALEEADPSAPAANPALRGAHPIYYTGLLKAVRLGGASASAWIADVVERRGVNFRTTTSQLIELHAAGAADSLVLLVNNSYRETESARPEPVAVPELPAARKSIPARTALVRRLRDIRRLAVETSEPELSRYLHDELDDVFRGRLSIVKTGAAADAVLRIRVEEEGGNKVVGAAGRVFGVKGRLKAIAEVTESREGVVLWHATAGDRAIGGFGDGAHRVASRVAHQLHDDWEN